MRKPRRPTPVVKPPVTHQPACEVRQDGKCDLWEGHEGPKCVESCQGKKMARGRG